MVKNVQLVTELHAGEMLPVMKPNVIVRSSKFFSAKYGCTMEVTGKHEVTGRDIVRRHYDGIVRYDALAYDNVPRDVKSGSSLNTYGDSQRVPNRETLISERKASVPEVKTRSVQEYNGYVYTPKYNHREYLEANSLDQLLLPTGANDLCPKCGLITSCQCDKPKLGDTKPMYQPMHEEVPNTGYRIKRIDPVIGTSPAILALNELLAR